jgi:hypothetical protein
VGATVDFRSINPIVEVSDQVLCQSTISNRQSEIVAPTRYREVVLTALLLPTAVCSCRLVFTLNQISDKSLALSDHQSRQLVLELSFQFHGVM